MSAATVAGSKGESTVTHYCIARDCGKEFDPNKFETRTNLRSFWRRYCPECRVKGNAAEPTVAGIPALYVVVELEDCDAEETTINVESGRNFAVGRIDGDGIVRLVDWSYRSPEEAKAAWSEIDGRKTLTQ
jgi:hypothetical protein